DHASGRARRRGRAEERRRGRRGAQGVRRAETRRGLARHHCRRDHGLGGRARGPTQARPPPPVRRPDPEVSLGQDPAPRTDGHGRGEVRTAAVSAEARARVAPPGEAGERARGTLRAVDWERTFGCTHRWTTVETLRATTLMPAPCGRRAISGGRAWRRRRPRPWVLSPR